MSDETTDRLAEIEGQAEPQPMQVREGRWRTRGGEIRNIIPTTAEDERAVKYSWHDVNHDQTWLPNGRYHTSHTESPLDLVQYLGPIEPDKTQELPDKTQELETKTQEMPETGEESPDQLIGRISLLRRRVTQLEELVASLRTINEAQEKAFNAAGKANTDLQHRLNVVAAEWAEQAETIRRLQIELDAAQQVPADSPELRQLRADLEQVTRERDEYRYAHDVLVKDANTVHERTKAMTVEAIAEWLEPVRLVDHPNLSNETLQHLPQIMRSLTGLADED